MNLGFCLWRSVEDVDFKKWGFNSFWLRIFFSKVEFNPKTNLKVILTDIFFPWAFCLLKAFLWTNQIQRRELLPHCSIFILGKCWVILWCSRWPRSVILSMFVCIVYEVYQVNVDHVVDAQLFVDLLSNVMNGGEYIIQESTWYAWDIQFVSNTNSSLLIHLNLFLYCCVNKTTFLVSCVACWPLVIIRCWVLDSSRCL